MGERGRPGWLVLAVAVPVGLPLIGRWQAVVVFAALVVAVVGPVFAVQWWSRRRQREAHARGEQSWHGHLPLDRAVGLWEFGVGAAFLYGGGVPVRLTAKPTGLTVTVRGRAAGRHPPVTVQWSDIATAHAKAAGRATDWGRVALLPITTVTIELTHGNDAFVVTTHDAHGLVELIRSQVG